MSANRVRGEAELVVNDRTLVLRPSFSALVAAEDDLGPLLALVESAADGQLRLGQIAALLWHCLPGEGRPTREEVGEAVLAMGLAEAVVPLRSILQQIVKGAG